MKAEKPNIYPVFDQILQRSDKQTILNQRSRVIWLTGLSGSGKTTIAKGLERKLHEKGFVTQLLDGDNVRTGINNNLGFSAEDRKENIRRIAEVSKLFLNCGIITINCFVSPTTEIRQLARSVIGKEDFIEVFVKASLEACESRDTKGLYKKARTGEISDFTGISAPFESPSDPGLVLDTEQEDVAASIDKLYQFILPKITLQ